MGLISISILIFIVGLFFFVFGIALCYKTQTKQIKLTEIEKEIDNLTQKKYNLNYEIDYLSSTKEKTLEDNYQSKVEELQKSYEEKEKELQEEYDNTKNRLNFSLSCYNKELDLAKQSLAAAARANLKEQENKNKIDFYRIVLTAADIHDIKALNSIRDLMREPRALSMVIWNQYYMKKMTDLCNRVLEKQNPCGIYKITNLLSGQTYIGQSVHVADRWKEHAKKGLGIDTPVTNKLYQAMLSDGLENFSFELIEKCSKEDLNAREKFWIDMYSSADYGMNSTKGNR